MRLNRFIGQAFLIVFLNALTACGSSFTSENITTTSTIPCAASGSPPVIPNISMQSVVSGFTAPVHVTNAGDDSNRLFVVEQAGTIRIVRNGALETGLFLDIRSRVQSGGEQGLLSLAFHPEFSTNNKFYVNYTSTSGNTIVSEFTLGATTILEDSERIILDIAQPYGNHNGGQIAFGPEKPEAYLYIGMGDGGDSGDPDGNGQDLTTLLGAMLRIDINSGTPYTIPTDNPLWENVTGARREIWSYGLRNPWRFSFDPLSGDLYAGDVGQNVVEEINIIEKEKNYGWNLVEGDICYTAGCDTRQYAAPIITHTHTNGWYSITGGVVYRGDEIPDLCGVYLYGDYVSSAVNGIRYSSTAGVSELRTLSNVTSLSSFGYDENYEVYALDLRAGTLYKVISP